MELHSPKGALDACPEQNTALADAQVVLSEGYTPSYMVDLVDLTYSSFLCIVYNATNNALQPDLARFKGSTWFHPWFNSSDAAPLLTPVFMRVPEITILVLGLMASVQTVSGGRCRTSGRRECNKGFSRQPQRVFGI